MKLFLPIFTVALVLNSSAAFACKCMSMGENFFSTVSNHNAKVQTEASWKEFALTIAAVRIDRHFKVADPNGTPPFANRMDVTISHVVQGKVKTVRQTIDGGNGASCTQVVSNFPVGSSWLLALNQTPNGRYYVSACGVYAQRMQKLAQF